MNRKIKSHKIVDRAISQRFNRKNKVLLTGFLEYLRSIDRSDLTIKAYKNDIEIFFTWNYESNNNKCFTRLKKKELASFQNYALTEWGWSPNRVARVKSALSSLSNYIEGILDDEYPNFHSVINKIPSPPIQNIFEQTKISEDEVDDTLNRLVTDRKYQVACIFALAAFSGSRRSELIQFKTGWFSENNIITGTVLYATPEKIRTKGRGTLGKPMIKYTLSDFKKYYDLWMDERDRQGITSEYLFVDKNGKQAKNSLLQSFARTISRYIGKSFYFHCLRHQLCTRLKRRGVPDDAIRTYFGWESIKMVEIYNDCESAEILMEYFSALNKASMSNDV
ncbi:tyrosine-type recombinase/integrase [Butyrivibrio sp. WCE2006]|uniref:tyrosine-type recombinase/integrase n=1 Tax=Butyrivibrio sp. WCE2006 TaxID=1410611 RepID=UPI0005D2725C|nr:site-specific integrase [Butyrivibrio sp. WCE2006]